MIERGNNGLMEGGIATYLWRAVHQSRPPCPLGIVHAGSLGNQAVNILSHQPVTVFGQLSKQMRQSC